MNILLCVEKKFPYESTQALCYYKRDEYGVVAMAERIKENSPDYWRILLLAGYIQHQVERTPSLPAEVGFCWLIDPQGLKGPQLDKD